MAAVLSCGPGALLSHRDGGALWGLCTAGSVRIDVSVPGGGRRHRGRIRVHRVRRLASDDIATRDGIPVTSLARTLLDLARSLPPVQFERAIGEAERLHLVDLRAVERLGARSRGHPGLPALTSALFNHRGEPPVTRSELERRFVDLCRMAGLSQPAMNANVAGLEVDALWRAERLIVELDGHEYHRTRAAFERDRLRDAALQLAGYRVLRFTHRRLTSDPSAVVRTLREMLRHGAPAGSRQPPSF
jgi:very-short-patch-repair endonuclease